MAIDAGHGGEDQGAKGRGGMKEKDLTLAVARRLKAALENRLGIRVLLTRDEDKNVPIDERTALANNNKADVLVSLHANASLRPGTALRLVVLLGVLSMLADVTYEGARSITGPFLATLGASGLVVGVVAGFGELAGYLIRLVSGRAATGPGRIWAITLFPRFVAKIPKDYAAVIDDAKTAAKTSSTSMSIPASGPERPVPVRLRWARSRPRRFSPTTSVLADCSCRRP